ncbi:MAG: hypothetical protein JW866_07090 [Ignavibacteriales bacterium]|nr:hypothetical protein [Ignavibacteriales bacterium]
MRIEMHGLNNYTCVYDHNVSIYINDVFVDNVQWDGQNKYLFQKIFPISLSGINFNSSGNKIRIETLGNICAAGLSDNILVNWFEFEYWAYLKANSNNLIYNSYPYVSGKKDFQIRNWNSSTIKIFIPEKEVIITNANIIGNPEGNVLFKDTLVADTRYYCVSNDFYLLPDSVVLDINSNLSNTSNGADYIIITHKNFTFAAQELATFRSNNLDGFENARVKVIDVQDIYDEFSYGLLNPYALKDFISYAFNNWTYPAPFYVVLFGDMSWDYKKLLPTSRPNFIPSIPYHSYQYGLAACDNNFVAVAGNDLIPDLSIGRLSCETIEEANILVEKIINYPTDYSKEWKENVILIGAGQNAEDEARFGFNNDNIALENLYLKNNGYTSTKIFRYPSTIEHQQFQGSGPEIRSAINNGGALVNFYGHGGGQQWDLVFLNDDIHLLQNGNKLPVVTSVTCYTAHFDNQNVFGEIFNKVPNKGSIGFWGNTGLTFYNSAVSLNKLVYDELCNKNNYVIGAAILSAKIRYGATYSGIIATDQMVLMTFLGDPALRCVLPDKPDFNIKSSFIATEPENPTVGSNAIVKILIQNLGRIFLGNEVKIKLIAIESDTTYSVGETQLSSFGQKDSVYFNWIPINSGLTILRAEINYDQAIDEIDFSDNSAEKDISVFNLGEPETIKPLDGHFTSGDEIDFLILKKEELENLKYYIEIDTTIFFTPPIFREEISSPADYFSYRLTKSQIEKGNYFWRVRSFDGFDSSDWTTPKSFTIKNVLGKGYYASGKHLDYFTKNNFYYDDSLRSLVLNIGLLPPKPQSRRLTDSIDVSLPPNFGMTTITNNGRFIYYANMSYFNSGEPSPIYKLGTGYNSIRGQDYGTIPNFEANIKSQIFHFDGYIYVVNGNPYYLVKVNPETGDTNNIFIPSGMLNKSGVVKSGDFYVNSDNKYVYNIALWDTNGNEHFVIRKFDPNNGWLKIGDDMITSSSSYIKGFGGFFICDDYFFPYEYYTSGFMRRIRISDGLFEEEWFTGEPYRGYFSWSYDNLNDVVYASTFRHLPNQIHIFTGHYKEGKGTVTTPKVGPSSQWKNIYYELNLSGYKGNYNTKLLGFNRYNKSWQEIKSNLQNGDDISDLDAKIYGYIKIISEFEDNTDIFSQPAKIENYQINFESVPELIMPFGLMDISKDTVLQGLKNEISFSVKNIGFIEADSALVEYFINNSDKAFYYEFINVPIDSLRFVSCEINTSELTKLNEIKIKVTSKYEELFTNNNVVKKSFFVNTDDVPPICKVTFDGVEILNGDYVSPSPKIIFLLKDNSPFPLDSSLISIYHNYRKLSYKEDSLNFDYTEYPRAEAIIEWHPTFEDGDNYISLYATDASKDTNNSVRYDINFIVSSDDKILDIYNYPNPFQSETYFTFNLTGKELPNDINIKIYTIAGRLIRDIHIPFTEMNYGFNKIRWDGTDQDGDEIANGVYFYKTTVKYDDKTEAQINKLAKVK